MSEAREEVFRYSGDFAEDVASPQLYLVDDESPSAEVTTPLTDEQRALVEAHMDYARRIIRKNVLRGRPLGEDMAQTAYVGLVKAAGRYNPSKGSFTSFAFNHITGEVKDEQIRSQPFSRAIINEIYEWWAAQGALTQKLQRLPTDQEIGQELGLEPDQTAELSQLSKSKVTGVSYIDELTNAQGVETEDDIIDRVDAAAQAKKIAGDIGNLSNQQREIFEKEFSQDLPLTSIAEGLGISVQATWNTKNRALKKLKKVLDD